LRKGEVAVKWNWLTKAMLLHENTINTSPSYKIYSEPVDHTICESCYVIEKPTKLVLNELDKQLINAVICPGCQCALPVK